MVHNKREFDVQQSEAHFKPERFDSHAETDFQEQTSRTHLQHYAPYCSHLDKVL